MKTAVRYCGICEKKFIGNKCGCGRDDFSTSLKPLTFDGRRIVCYAVVTAALASMGWLLFDALIGGR